MRGAIPRKDAVKTRPTVACNPKSRRKVKEATARASRAAPFRVPLYLDLAVPVFLAAAAPRRGLKPLTHG